MAGSGSPLTQALGHENISPVTVEELQRLLEPFWRTDDGRTAAERAEVYGIDLSLLTENLRLTPEERIDRNQAALELATALEEGRG